MWGLDAAGYFSVGPEVGLDANQDGEGLDADHGYFDVGLEVGLGLGYKRMPSSMR